MGKFFVGLLAVGAALGIIVHLVGAHRMTTTALSVPATEHTSAFPITWTLVCGGVLAFGVWRILKGK